MPDHQVCLNLKASLETLSSLKHQFDSAFDLAVSSEDPIHIKQAKEHKLAFIKQSHALRESITKDKIILREQEANKRFFGPDVDCSIPPLPKEATLERITEWREHGFELKYLPTACLVDITEDPPGVITQVKAIQNIPGWQKKSNDLFNHIHAKTLPKEAATLPGGWILVDIRPKPNYDDGQQMYENDPLAPALAELNRQGIIKQMSDDGGTPLHPESRFGLSPNDLAKSEVKQAFANILGLTPGQVSLQSALIFNILGNRDHLEWGETDTREWFADQTFSFSQLHGGASDGGGLSDVLLLGLDARYGRVGFRLIGRFPSSEESAGVSS